MTTETSHFKVVNTIISQSYQCYRVIADVKLNDQKENEVIKLTVTSEMENELSE